MKEETGGQDSGDNQRDGLRITRWGENKGDTEAVQGLRSFGLPGRAGGAQIPAFLLLAEVLRPMDTRCDTTKTYPGSTFPAC